MSSLRVLISFFIFTLIVILISEYIIDFSSWVPKLPLLISTGLFPVLIFLIPTAGFLYYWYKVKNTGFVETVMSLVTIIITSYIVMMAVGVWFRGEGMNLIF